MVVTNLINLMNVKWRHFRILEYLQPQGHQFICILKWPYAISKIICASLKFLKEPKKSKNLTKIEIFDKYRNFY